MRESIVVAIKRSTINILIALILSLFIWIGSFVVACLVVGGDYPIEKFYFVGNMMLISFLYLIFIGVIVKQGTRENFIEALLIPLSISTSLCIFSLMIYSFCGVYTSELSGYSFSGRVNELIDMFKCNIQAIRIMLQ